VVTSTRGRDDDGHTADAGDDREHLQLTTLQGWRRFVAEVPAVPNLLAESVWSSLEADKRADYDDARIEHHSRLLVVQTPTIREVVTRGRRLVLLNTTATTDDAA
jgi:hypothetical protein